jgi:hypothetical protein
MDFSVRALYHPDQFRLPRDQRYQEHFINRQNEREQLIEALGRSNCIDVYGEHGIGKTALVKALWHSEQALAFPDGMFWIRSPRACPEEIPDALLVALRRPGLRVRLLSQQLVEIRQQLEGKRVLIVLDEASDQREMDIAQRCTPATCTLLTTVSHSRRLGDPKDEVLHIQSLSPQDAIELFRTWLDEQTRHRYARLAGEICSVLEGVPLALELVSRSIAWSVCPPRQALVQLRAQQERFDRHGDRAVRTALGFCIARLRSDLLEPLGILHELPARRLGKDLVQAVIGTDEEDRLGTLLDLGLVRVDELGYYTIPALSNMLDVWSPQSARRLEGQTEARLSAFLRNYVTANAQVYERLERARDLLVWIIRRHSGRNASTWTTTSLSLMVPFLRDCGYWSDLEQLLRAGIRIATELADLKIVSQFQHQLALLYFRSGRDEQAVGLFQENRDLLRDLEDYPALSLTLYAMGAWYEKKGDTDSAHALYRQVSDLPVQTVPAYIHAVHRFGQLSLERNDTHTAKRAFLKAHDTSRQFLSSHTRAQVTPNQVEDT